jgi:hypothetical protein
VQDALGLRSANPIYFEITDSQTIAQALSEASTYAGLVNAVTDGVVARVSLSLDVAALPSAGSKPLSTARVSNVAVFDYIAAATRRIWGQVVPAIAQSKLSGNRINNADSDVAALIGFTAGTAAPYQATDPDSQALTDFKDSFLGVRKHRRLEHEASINVS